MRITSTTQRVADLGRVAALRAGDAEAFCAELDRLVRANFTGDYWTISLPNRLDTSAARSPALFAYWAALNLLDAELLFSELRIRDLLDPNTTAPRSIERHHLFPRAYLNARGITTARQVNAIANMAFLDWPENATISSEGPLEYWPFMTGGMDAERVQQQRYWHALPIGWEQLDYAAFLERRRELIAQVMHDGFNRLWESDTWIDQPTTLSDLLTLGESQTVEYKSSARWNLHTGQADKRLEHVITKTVCGFLNAEGGSLLIGVDDSGSVLGLRNDMRTLGDRASRDGYELFLRQRLDTDLSISTAAVVKIGFGHAAGADVCVVSVAPSGKPVFAKPREGGHDPTEFWVRVGNATKQLHGDDMLEYQSKHWG